MVIYVLHSFPPKYKGGYTAVLPIPMKPHCILCITTLLNKLVTFKFVGGIHHQKDKTMLGAVDEPIPKLL